MKKIILMTLCALVFSFTSAKAIDKDSDNDWSDINILFLIWTAEDVEFFVPSINGAHDAAEDQGISMYMEFGDSDTAKTNDILETAIANEVDGIAMTVWDDDAFDEIVCKAMEAGIPVVLHNIDDSQRGKGNCRMAYVGQFFIETGETLGERMIAEHGLKAGDHVFTPVEFPEAVYAVQRHEGVNNAITANGGTTEILGTGTDHSEALNIMVQYLLGHPETKAVIGLGSTPTSVAVRAVEEAGLDIPVGGYDITPEILDNIANGSLTATVDQQPYHQGYMSVTMVAQYLKYGLLPADMNTGGSGLVDKSNVESAFKWAGITR